MADVVKKTKAPNTGRTNAGIVRFIIEFSRICMSSGGCLGPHLFAQSPHDNRTRQQSGQHVTFWNSAHFSADNDKCHLFSPPLNG